MKEEKQSSSTSAYQFLRNARCILSKKNTTCCRSRTRGEARRFYARGKFFADIVELLQTARNTAYRAINSVMVQTYLKIEKRIVERE